MIAVYTVSVFGVVRAVLEVSIVVVVLGDEGQTDTKKESEPDRKLDGKVFSYCPWPQNTSAL